MTTYLRLLSYVKPYWVIFSISLLGFLIFAATQPLFAALIQRVVDAIQHKDESAHRWIPLVFIAIVLVRGAGSFLGNYYMAKVGNSIVNALRLAIFERYAILPSAFFDERNSGHLLSLLTYNVTQVTSAATVAIRVVVREGLTVVGLLGYLLYMEWRLSLIFIAISPLIGGAVFFANKRFRKLSRKIQASMGDVTHVCSELLQNHRVVRSFGGEPYEQSRFAAASDYYFRQSMRMVKTSCTHTPLLQLIVASALATLIYLALRFMSDASTGEVIAYFTAAALLPKPIRELSGVNATIQQAIAAAESIFEILDEPAEVDRGTYEAPRAAGDLEFRDVCFAYGESARPVLHNVSFRVKPGESVALVGHSGSGKSTLISLIPRFYDYRQGRILLDGVDIRDYTLPSLRRQIALVTQQVNLFNDTIEKNIAYGGLAGAARADVMHAASVANAMEFIEKLPRGLDTLVGENGIKLSGGQRQRLAIARALLKDAPILILDEATSALDTESERKIQQALDAAMRGRTTIVIAHRLSTVEHVDRIIVLDEGRIAEQGDHRTLLARGTLYPKLYQLQFSAQRTAEDAPAAAAS